MRRTVHTFSCALSITFADCNIRTIAARASFCSSGRGFSIRATKAPQWQRSTTCAAFARPLALLRLNLSIGVPPELLRRGSLEKREADREVFSTEQDPSGDRPDSAPVECHGRADKSFTGICCARKRKYPMHSMIKSLSLRLRAIRELPRAGAYDASTRTAQAVQHPG